MKHVIGSVVDISESPILTHGTRPWYDVNDRDGVTVLSYDHVLHSGGADFLEFCVKKVTPGEDNVPKDVNDGIEYYIAATPYRKEMCCGVSPQEAIGMLLYNVANLARMGAMNPKYPGEPGDPPIQHAISILTERLSWQIERRHGLLQEMRNDTSPEQYNAEAVQNRIHGQQCADIIAALGTAIAALARVKDL